MYKEEIEEIFNSPNQALELTKYVNDDIFINEFVEFTKPAFIVAKKSANIDRDTERKVFMAFTFIALKHYDGKLWNHIYAYYESSNLTKRDIYNKVRINVFSQWVKGYHCDTDSREQTYQIPVIESIIPYPYAIKFVDFVFDIYVKCLDYSLDNLDKELDIFFDATRELLQNDDDSDKFESKDIDGSSKTYILIQGTKRIIKYKNFKNKLKQLKEFTKQFLYRIDNYYTQSNFIENNYYFDKTFENWIITHPITKIKSISGERALYQQNRKPKFILNVNNGKVILRTPMLRLAQKEDPTKVKIHIYENKEEIYCCQAHCKYIMSLMEINYIDYEIKDPLNDISCKITYDDEVLYESYEKLYRKNIFFNAEKEVKPNTKYNGKLYVLCRQINKTLNLVISLTNYLIYSLEVTEDKYSFLIDSTKYSFKGFYENEISGDECKEICVELNNENVKVFRSVTSIILTSKSRSIKANYIMLNGRILHDDVYECKEQQTNIAYIINVEKLLDKPGFYIIDLIDKSTNHILVEYRFILDNSFKIEEEIDEYGNIQCNFSSLYKITSIDGCRLQKITSEINKIDDNVFYLHIDACKFILHILLTIPYYIIDNGKKMIFGTENNISDLNINSIIYLYNVKNNVMLLVGDYSRNLQVKNKGLQKYIELSEVFNHKDMDYVNIKFLDFNDNEEFITIYNKPIYDLEQSNIYLDSINQTLIAIPYIHGVDIIKELRILIMVDGIVKENESINNCHNNFKYDLDAYKHIIKIKVGYDIDVIDYNTFGVFKEFNTIYEEDFNYIPLDSLIGKLLYVKNVICENTNNTPENVRPLFLKLVKKLSSNSYFCESYIDSNGTYKSKLGKLFIECEPIYVAETNNKRRINASISLSEANIPLYYDNGCIEIEKTKWSSKIDYIVIEENIAW